MCRCFCSHASPLPPWVALLSLLEARCRSLCVTVRPSVSPWCWNHSWKGTKFLVFLDRVFTSERVQDTPREELVALTHNMQLRAGQFALQVQVPLSFYQLISKACRGLSWLSQYPSCEVKSLFMNFWLHHSRNVPTRAVTHTGKPQY